MISAGLVLLSGGKSGRLSPARWPGRGYPLNGQVNADGSWVAWRLCSGNNRELGRSADVYPDGAACTAAFEVLQSRIAEAEATVVADNRADTWSWRLSLDGRLVAVASRGYLRQRECHYSLRQFLAAVPGKPAAASAVAPREIVLPDTSLPFDRVDARP